MKKTIVVTACNNENVMPETNAFQLVYQLIVACLVFILATYVLPFYTLSDQKLYSIAYTGIANLKLREGYEFYSATLGSSEFVHYLITWITSGWGIEKNLVVAASSGLLALLSMKLFLKWGASTLIAILITLTNYYMILMYLDTERLKFGFIFLALTFLYWRKNKGSYVFAVLSIFSHFQVLLIYAGYFAVSTQKVIVKLFRTMRFSKSTLLFMILTSLLLAYISGPVFLKFQYYSTEAAQTKGLSDLIRIILLLFLSLLYSKNRNETFLVFIPLILAVYIVGSDRVNMLGYFVFLYYGLQCRKGLNVGILVTTLYFSIKSFEYISNIVEYGDGFKTMISQ